MLKKININRMVPVILLMIILVPSVLCACQQTPTFPDTEQGSTNGTVGSSSSVTSSAPSSSAPSAENEESYFDRLEKEDMGGKEIRIAAYRSRNIFPSSAADIIDDIALKRNIAVEEKYNVKLVQAQISGSDFFNSLRIDRDSGLVNCDIVVAPVDMLDLFVTYSMYTNVNTLGVGFNKPYYDSEAMDALTTGMITYGVVGDYTASPENSHCLFYNKTAFSAQGFEDMVKTVDSGTWTWNLLLDWANKSTAKNSPMKMDYGFSSSCNEAEFINMVWASSGVNFFKLDHPYNPVLNVETSVANPIIKIIKSLRSSKTYYGADEKKQQSALDSFCSGKMLFYISEISDLASMTNCDFSVGIAPIPKTSADQTSYYSYTDNSFQAVFVLDNCSDLALTGKIIDALNAASYELMDDAYLDLYMHMYLSSNKEGLILKDVINSNYYEIGYLLGGVYNQFASATTDTIYRVVTAGGDFRTIYKQNEKQFKRFLSNKIFNHPAPPTSSVPTSVTGAATSSSIAAPTVTAQPTVTVAPTAKPTVKPTVTVAPSATVKPTVTVAPTAKPTTKPTPTVRPTVTVKPTETVKPTVTVAPSDTIPVSSAPASVSVSSSAPISSVASTSSAAPVTSSSVAATSSVQASVASSAAVSSSAE